jgi:hypothetical protein
VQGISVSEGLAELHYNLRLYLLQCELQLLEKFLETYALLGNVTKWNLGGDKPQAMHVEHFDQACGEVFYNSLSSSLRSNLLKVFNTMKEEVDNCPATAHFLLEGAGGTWKLSLYYTICSYYHSKGH